MKTLQNNELDLIDLNLALKHNTEMLAKTSDLKQWSELMIQRNNILTMILEQYKKVA